MNMFSYTAYQNNVIVNVYWKTILWLFYNYSHILHIQYKYLSIYKFYKLGIGIYLFKVYTNINL